MRYRVKMLYSKCYLPNKNLNYCNNVLNTVRIRVCTGQNHQYTVIFLLYIIILFRLSVQRRQIRQAEIYSVSTK